MHEAGVCEERMQIVGRDGDGMGGVRNGQAVEVWR